MINRFFYGDQPDRPRGLTGNRMGMYGICVWLMHSHLFDLHIHISYHWSVVEIIMVCIISYLCMMTRYVSFTNIWNDVQWFLPFTINVLCMLHPCVCIYSGNKISIYLSRGKQLCLYFIFRGRTHITMDWRGSFLPIIA